jgi:molybdopterin synthase catalytic subunit
MGPIVQLTHEPIDYAQLTEAVRSKQAGAVVLFLGTVREMTAGRRTVALGYDAYPAMALSKMQELCTEAAQRWPVVRAALVHRLGRLEPGDVSVAVAVSCPHRAQAFEAGRYLIDRLKEVVPVWKQENWADGTTEWVHPGADVPTASIRTWTFSATNDAES